MKLPLSYTLKNRDSTTAKDARVLNGYVEIRGDPKKGGSIRTFKRPAVDSAFELDAGPGQGLFVPTTPEGDGEPQVVINDILTRSPSAKKKSLSWGVQPAQEVLNTAISPSMTVRILDSVGNVSASANDAVTIALFSNPTGATLGGTTTRNAVSGVATFNDITLDRSGEGFVFQATATSLRTGYSSEFNIPTQLAFTVQPSTVAPNTQFSVTVTAQDTAGNTDTRYSGFITMDIYSASPGGATLGGNLLRAAVNGVATFSDLTVDIETTCTLIATAAADSGIDCYTPALRVSNSFTVATFTHTLMAAQSLSSPFIFGFDATAGSISPTTLSGRTITALYGDAETPTNDTVFTISGAAVSQNFFTSLEVVGVGTLLTASATSFNGNTWQWGGTNLITTTGTFLVNIT